MANIVDQREFYKELFREVILEVMHEEKLGFYDSIFPNANKDEIEDITSQYGTPEKYNQNDFEDMTEWISNAN